MVWHSDSGGITTLWVKIDSNTNTEQAPADCWLLLNEDSNLSRLFFPVGVCWNSPVIKLNLCLQLFFLQQITMYLFCNHLWRLLILTISQFGLVSCNHCSPISDLTSENTSMLDKVFYLYYNCMGIVKAHLHLCWLPLWLSMEFSMTHI